MSAYLAPSLVRLRNEINLAFPHRDKRSDGWLGDAAHASRVSDHNPDSRGIVHAIDVDVDDGDPNKDLRTRLIAQAIRHPSTHYVISNGKIYSREYGFRARVYTGTNGHYHHVHVSILRTRTAETSTRPWGIRVVTTHPNPYPVPVLGSREYISRTTKKTATEVKFIQWAAGGPAYDDGDWQSKTDDLVGDFQDRHGLRRDLRVGKDTLAKMVAIRR